MRWLLKRWWFWAGTGFILVAVCAGYLLIPDEKARITQANCDMIQLGRSHEQVNGLLGGSGTFLGNLVTRLRYRWEDEDGNRIEVWFETEQVVFKHFNPSGVSLPLRIKRRIIWRVRALWP
jgi:hypothetical protein